MTNPTVIAIVFLYLLIATIVRYFIAGLEARWYTKAITSLLWPITIIVGVVVAVVVAVIKVWVEE